MSDPKLQRANGCGIFATLIVSAILISAFIFIQKIFEREPQPVATQEITDERLRKIEAYETEAEKFSAEVHLHHAERNSSIDSVLQGVVERYTP